MFPRTAGAGNQQAWSKFLRSAKKAMVPYSAHDSASAVPENTAMSDDHRGDADLEPIIIIR
jgi:hypothetical protein